MNQEEKLERLVDLMEEASNRKATDPDLRELMSLREAIQKADPLRGKKTPDLFARIMTEVEEQKPQPRWIAKVTQIRVLAPVAAAAVAVMVLGLLQIQSPIERPLAGIEDSPQIMNETPVDQMLVFEGAKDPSAAAEALNAPGSDQEFALDVLATQMEGLSGEQVDSVFESLMEE